MLRFYQQHGTSHLTQSMIDMMITNSSLIKAANHVKEWWPAEAVGLVMEDGTFRPMVNESNSPMDAWELSEEQLVSQLGDDAWTGDPVFAILHSHPNGQEIPGETDVSFMYYMLDVWPHVFHMIMTPFSVTTWCIDGDNLCLLDRLLL